MSIASNNAVIAEAVAKAKARMDNSITAGLSACLAKGMDYCLEEHPGVNGRFVNHERMRDTYGWILCYDGREVNRAIYSPTENGRKRGKIGAILSDLASSAAPGWCGFVAAAMSDDSGNTHYFNWSAECGMMRTAISSLSSVDLSKCFRRI